MFAERQAVQIVILIVVTVLVLVGSMFYTLVRINHENNITRREKNRTCASIKDERLIDDCLNGGYYVERLAGRGD